MSRRQPQETTFPLGRLDAASVFVHPTQDDHERAKDKARQLLKSIVSEKEWAELEDRSIIQLTGKRGNYLISPYTRTEIRDLQTGAIKAYACLQLTIPAPIYDRMVAEYLLIKNREDVYWKTANIFSQSGDEFEIATLLLIVLDIALFFNMFLEILKIR